MTPPRKQRGKDLSSDLPIPAILFPFWAFFTRTRAPAIVRANSQSTRTRGTGGGTLGTRENFRDVTQPRRHRRALSRAPGTRRHARVRREGLHAPTRNALKTFTGASRDESARVSRSSRARAARSRGSSRSRRGFAFFFPCERRRAGSRKRVITRGLASICAPETSRSTRDGHGIDTLRDFCRRPRRSRAHYALLPRSPPHPSRNFPRGAIA